MADEPRKLTKADKKFREAQDEFAKLVYAEPLILMVALVRRTFDREAICLEEQLDAMGLSRHERETIYKALSVRRAKMEAELYEPLAYEKLKAQAEVSGLLTKPTGEFPQLKEEAP